MFRRAMRPAVLMAALPAMAVLLGCEDSEKIAPEGSTVSVSANPATIPLTGEQECLDFLKVPSCGTAQVVATVSSELGLPLPDQDVRFRSTAGLLFTGDLEDSTSVVPVANLPIATDEFGNATVNLVTSTTTTVTGQSGKASGTLTISTVAGNLSTILLQNDTMSTGCTSSTTDVTNCNQAVCFVATAQTANGTGIPGVVLVFNLQNNDAMGNTFNATFNPPQATTNSSGKAFTTMRPNADCSTECGGKSCQAEVVATTEGGGFPSIPVVLTINIP